MKRKEQLLRQAQRDLEAFVEERLRLEQEVAEQQQMICAQTLRLEELQSMIEQLKRMLFGPKSERMTEEQAAELAAVVGDLTEQEQRPRAESDTILAEEDTQGGGETEKETPRRGKRQSRQMPVNLEVQTTILEPTHPPCTQCGQMGEEIGREVSEQVDLIPAKLIVRRTVRIKRKCRCGCGQIAIAPLPPQILPGSKLGLGLAVFILLSKYDDHVALYTLERIFRERHAVVIPRQQMVQWIEHLAGLLRLIVDRMWVQIKRGDYIQIDETPVRVLDPEIKGRRKFYDAALQGDRQGIWFIARFRELYRIEDEVKTMSFQERQKIRSERAPQIWAEMKTRAQELQGLALPQSLLGKALGYFLREFNAMQIYLERPDYQIDNNLVENSIRPSCVGRKRWLFIGHPQAGWRSAVIYSIVQSCRRRGIDPQQYLTDVLGRLPGMTNTQIDCLLPGNWKAARFNSS